MERYNSAGIRRDELLFALRTPHMVLIARRFDCCLLCRCSTVNEAGLCDLCYSMLHGDELTLATRWMAGVGP